MKGPNVATLAFTTTCEGSEAATPAPTTRAAETFCDVMGLEETDFGFMRTRVCYIALWISGGGSVNNNNKRISIRSGAAVSHGDRRCKRVDCIFPNPTVRFDREGHRLVAVWSWTGVGVANDGSRVKITVVPTLRLVPLSHN